MAINRMHWNLLQEFNDFQKKHFIELMESHLQSEAEEEDIENVCMLKIEAITSDVVDSLSKGHSPVVRVLKKHLSSKFETQLLGEDFVSLGKTKHTARFTQLMDVLSKSYVLMKSNSYATLRDVFYEDVKLYITQKTLDKTVDDAARLLDVPRRHLHITSTSKGLIAGNLKFVTREQTIVNVTDAIQGAMVPSYIEGLHSFTSDARFILVIEKDATFQNLLQSHFLRAFGPCILITGKGQPDLCTRQLLRILWIELKIPVLALVDADPYGLHIAAVYKFGALAREDSKLRVEGLVLLGILPSDLKNLQLPEQVLLPLTPRDYGKLASLEAHPKLKNSDTWLHQIQCLRKLGKKAEIQSLTQISQDFLSTVYLPTKISSGGWIL